MRGQAFGSDPSRAKLNSACHADDVLSLSLANGYHQMAGPGVERIALFLDVLMAIVDARDSGTCRMVEAKLDVLIRNPQSPQTRGKRAAQIVDDPLGDPAFTL